MPLDRESIRTLLQNAKRPVLADILGKLWELPLIEYSAALWEKPTSTPPVKKHYWKHLKANFAEYV